MSSTFKSSVIISFLIFILLFPSRLNARDPSFKKTTRQANFISSKTSLISYNQHEDISLFHSVVINSILLENEKFFREINEENRGIVEHYFDTFSVELFNRKNELPYETEPYYGDIDDDEDIKKEVAFSSGMSAFRDTVSNTPVGVKLERMAEEIASYLVIEYSKEENGVEPSLYLPGELHPKKSDTKKEYFISLSTSFDPDTDLLRGNFPVELKCGYLGVLTNAVYDFGKDRLSLNLYKQNLEMLPGANFGVSLNHDDRWEFIGFFQFSYEF